MSDIPSFPYADLWEERVLRSVANLTRADAEEFLALAPQVPVRTTVTPFSIGEAEDALSRLRAGAIEGAAVVLRGELSEVCSVSLLFAAVGSARTAAFARNVALTGQPPERRTRFVRPVRTFRS